MFCLVKGYFIQYKFILPKTTKHSSYTYQKLFRAIYGYTQAVYKSSGKKYSYHRSGVLSDFPHVRVGKNCVVIHPNAFQPLLEFFKTGKNPTHKWEGRGDWKAVYYMNEKEVPENQLVLAVERALDRKFVVLPSKTPEKLAVCLAGLKNGEILQDNRGLIIPLAQKTTENDWFKEVYQKSTTLSEFYSNFKAVKGI